MKLSSFIRDAVCRLSLLYPVEEARAIAVRLCCERLGVDSYTHIIEPELEMASDLSADLLRLVSGEPLQYVLGYADFCGHRFKVAPGVLIPRPETEGLVELALSAKGHKVLDLCTGSGCIAWSLALEGRSVTAVDVSRDALAIAAAQPFEADVRFKECSILEEPSLKPESFDIVVSNPPYIMERERASMMRNVLEFEPSLALFVPDDDPLVFYRAVAEWAGVCLRRRGTGIVEINEKLGAETAALFEDTGFEKVRICDDYFGKNRFIVFEK